MLSICPFFNLFCRGSSVRPGQFGYGKVPFSLPLHRTNRQARHTVNGTDEAPGLTVVKEDTQEEEETGREGGEVNGEVERTEEENGNQQISKAPAAEKEPVPTESPRVDRTSHSEHRRSRFPPQHSSPRSSSPSVFVNRHRFDWNSVTAPPPLLSHPRSPDSSPLFTSPLHRPNPAHVEREPHPGVGLQAPAAGSVYPFQNPRTSSHLGAEAGRHRGGETPRLIRCSGPEKEYRRCFSQVGMFLLLTT